MRARPTLTLEFDAKSETAVEKVVSLLPSGQPAGREKDAAFLRLAVSNATGRRTAEDVEVLVVRIDQVGEAECYGSLFSLWADETRLNFAPLGWTHLVPTQVAIGPGLLGRSTSAGTFAATTASSSQ